MGINTFFSKNHHLKPREKARNLGIESLEDYELLALLLETGTKSENVLELSQRYLKEKGGLSGIFAKNEANLTSFGVKDAKVFRLLAIKEILRRLPYLEKEKMKSADDAFEKTKGEFFAQEKELLLVYLLDRQKNIIATIRYSSYEVSKVDFPVEEILEKAYGTRAKFVLLIHNHPSGSLHPSSKDIEAVTSLCDKLRVLGILLLDSLIVNNEKYYSFRKEHIAPFQLPLPKKKA